MEQIHANHQRKKKLYTMYNLDWAKLANPRRRRRRRKSKAAAPGTTSPPGELAVQLASVLYTLISSVSIKIHHRF